jgi:hypothetical protein
MSGLQILKSTEVITEVQNYSRYIYYLQPESCKTVGTELGVKRFSGPRNRAALYYFAFILFVLFCCTRHCSRMKPTFLVLSDRGQGDNG